jgi:peptide deformylase
VGGVTPPDATGDHQIGHVVNPDLLPPSAFAGPVLDTEGCLSIPGQHAELARPGLATVTGFDLTGAPITVTGSGRLARCLQHETDHLNGILYVDHLPEARRREILAAMSVSSEKG